jgi:hypothetical protein
MKEQYHIFWELMLIFASIIVFRSVWLLLDEYIDNNYLIPLFIVGILLSIPALYMLNRHIEDRKKK